MGRRAVYVRTGYHRTTGLALVLSSSGWLDYPVEYVIPQICPAWLTLLVVIAFLLSSKTAVAKAQSLGLMLLLAAGFLYIMSLAIRVAFPSSTGDRTHLPSASWLAIWSIVEASVAMIAGCSSEIYKNLVLVAGHSPAANHGPDDRFDNRGYQKQLTNSASVPQMHDLVLASKGHTRVTSINGSVVGVSPSRHRLDTPQSVTNAHGLITLRPQGGYRSRHQRETSNNGPGLGFWKEVDDVLDKDSIVQMSTPALSKRTSKTSMKHTPIQIPGMTGQRKDATGALSGAFWSDMGEGERRELEERSKEIKIRVKESRVIGGG